MRVRAGEVQVELHWQPGEPMPELVFDPEGIHRAVLNVVTNAIDAVSERETPGRVEVATQYCADEGLVRITVDDNGPGIPADQMEHLFSPFVSSKKSRGTGLGLPVSQKILQRARRPDRRRKRARPGLPLHARTARHAAADAASETIAST